MVKKEKEQFDQKEKPEISQMMPGTKEPVTEVYEDLYREGDIVPETGHYVCVICGQIESFGENEEFTTCPAGHGEKDVVWKNMD